MATHSEHKARNATRTLVIVATYNERENIASLVREVLDQADYIDMLIVDDNSPDGTGEIVDGLAAADERVNVLHRDGKLGLGTALLAGLRNAMANGYQYGLTMDADFSHHPRYLYDLIDGMRNHDLMMGSRYVPNGGVVGWGIRRKIMSWGANMYARVILGLKARDCSGGFKCYRVSMLDRIDFDGVMSTGYSIQEEMVFLCQRAGFRVGESPIVFEDRQAGTSKINWREVLGLFWTIPRLRLQHVFRGKKEE